MSLSKADLILHPVRLRILQTLTADFLTTQQISQQLPDIPTSSIYRHLKLLLDSEMVEVADTQQVRGIQEKVYRLAQAPYLSATDVAGLTADDHISYFTTFTLTLLHDFMAYAQAAGEAIDLAKDMSGYTDVVFWANGAELMEMFQAINQAILPWVQLGPGNGRHKHKFATITHPLAGEDSHGTA